MSKPEPQSQRGLSIVESAIPLNIIRPSTFNRRTITKEKMDELVASIKVQGVLQAILVRPVENGKAEYEIVAGEQRWHAAQAAGLKTIPAIARNMTDAEAQQAQLTENLQRNDIHPLDEARQFSQLHKLTNQTLKEVGKTVGKDETYVSRRVLLLNLVEPVVVDYRAGLITLGHALAISRLNPDVQPYALSECYARTYKGIDKATGDEVYEYKKDQPHTVQHLEAWIEERIMLDLHQAPFKMDDDRLRPDKLTCVNCPNRTGFNKMLFPDVRKNDTCTNPLCFQTKVATFIQLQRVAASGDEAKPAVRISGYHGRHEAKDPAILDRSQYELIEKRGTVCEFAEKAVFVNGRDNKIVGTIVTVCQNKKCKDHLGKYSTGSSSSSMRDDRRPKAGSAEFNKRKQELFDVKVDDEVRRRILQATVPTFKGPLNQDWLRRVAANLFTRIDGYCQGTVRDVALRAGLIDSDKRLQDRGMSNQGYLLEDISKFTDRQLAQFMALCATAHLGENQYLKNKADQRGILALATERGVDSRLIDAQVRHELTSKKCLKRHAAYLAAVESGDLKAEPPKVYGDDSPAKLKPKAGAKKAAKKTASKAAKKRPAKKR